MHGDDRPCPRERRANVILARVRAIRHPWLLTLLTIAITTGLIHIDCSVGAPSRRSWKGRASPFRPPSRSEPSSARHRSERERSSWRSSKRHHPIWTKLVASSLIVLGLAVLYVGGSWLTLALVLYGAGIGLESIARGTLPLALVGPRAYPVVMGRIALPNMMVQAASPLVGSLLLGVVGADGTVTVLAGAAVPQPYPVDRPRDRDRRSRPAMR